MKVLNMIVATSALAVAALVSAQGPMGGMGGGRQGGGPGMGGRRPDPKQQVDRMGQALSLTAAQKAKLVAILTKSEADMKKVRDARDAAMKKVLTADQQKKMAAMRGGGMRGGPGGGMGGPQGGMRRGG